jgi:peptidoglycan-associated lipoprotein
MKSLRTLNLPTPSPRLVRTLLTLLCTLTLSACVTTTYDWQLTGQPTLARRPTAALNTGPVSSPAQLNGLSPGSLEDFITNVGDRVYFGFDLSNLSPDAVATLERQADWLNRYPNVSARIEGNTDERGTREYNLALGERRAETVRSYLISRGIAPTRLSTVSFGEETPLEPGANEGAYARNRNVRTVVITAGGAR